MSTVQVQKVLKAAVLAVSAVIATSLISGSASARDLTFGEVYITHTTDTNGQPILIGNDTLANWCSGYGNGLDFGTFATAQYLSNQKDGLYLCKGEFVNVPGRSRIQLFLIDDCTAKDPADLRKSCPQP